MNPEIKSRLSSLSDQDLIQSTRTNTALRNHAKELLLERYEPLVRSVALSSRYRGVNTDDLLQSGRFGFLCALNKYDPGKGASLGTYTRHYILKHVEACFSAYLSDHISLETILTDDGEGAKIQEIGDEGAMQAFDSVDLFAEISAVQAFIDTLTPRQQDLVRRVFYEGSTLAESSSAMRISKPRVSQLIRAVYSQGERALAHLRN